MEQTESKIGVCAQNKLIITFDGQIGAYHVMMHSNKENEDVLVFGLCQLKRKVGPAACEGLLTDDDFPDQLSDDTPCVLFDFTTEASLDVFIQMLENYRKERFEE